MWTLFKLQTAHRRMRRQLAPSWRGAVLAGGEMKMDEATAALGDELAGALAGLDTSQLAQLCEACTEPADEGSKVLNESIADGTIVAAMQAVVEQAAMPEDAERRWGADAACHRCAKRDGNCFAQLARADPAALDAMRARLERAKEHAAREKRVLAAVPLAKQQKLADDGRRRSR